ncbi:unnamed protein product [Ilex paraguariensis]|uniref:Uncharacterized protein n=1 Tax=Ilex paraguariensis TaxID=185542 RepID=A0ABC8RUE4_9AQUA
MERERESNRQQPIIYMPESIDREKRVETYSELKISVNGKMEKEKKRKRVTEVGEVDGGSGRMKKEKVEREKAKAAPSEEEVDEFFEILRRMQVAVKYFEKSSDGDGNANANDKANGDGRRLTDLLGTEVDDVTANEKGLNQRLVKGVLDLNAVPAESNSF